MQSCPRHSPSATLISMPGAMCERLKSCRWVHVYQARGRRIPPSRQSLTRRSPATPFARSCLRGVSKCRYTRRADEGLHQACRASPGAARQPLFARSYLRGVCGFRYTRHADEGLHQACRASPGAAPQPLFARSYLRGVCGFRYTRLADEGFRQAGRASRSTAYRRP